MPRKALIDPCLSDIYAGIGKNVLRQRGPMTQLELAEKAGVSRSTIENIEKGIGCSLENLIKVAAGLGIKPADLFISDADRKEVTYMAVLLMEKIKESLTIK